MVLTLYRRGEREKRRAMRKDNHCCSRCGGTGGVAKRKHQVKPRDRKPKRKKNTDRTKRAKKKSYGSQKNRGAENLNKKGFDEMGTHQGGFWTQFY